MFNFLKRKLGINEILTALNRVELREVRDLKAQLKTLHEQICIHNRALGRIIAINDPNYSRDELNPTRRAESDRIGDEVMKRLLGEHRASNPPSG